MNKDWVEHKTHLWSMPSKPKFPLEEEEVKAKGNVEAKEEVEAKTEEEETTLQILMERATIKIRTKAKEAISKEDKIKQMDKGMINPKSNVITIISMAIMPINLGRN